MSIKRNNLKKVQLYTLFCVAFFIIAYICKKKDYGKEKRIKY